MTCYDTALFLGIDLGTTYFKFGLYDREGGLQGLGRVATPTRHLDAVRHEIPVAAFWDSVATGIREACDAARADPARIAAISYSTQANTFMLADENDQPLMPLWVWTDSRAGIHPEAEALWADPAFLRHTGIGSARCTGSLANKVCAIREANPERWRRARRLMTLSDLLVFGLTGCRHGDAGSACLLGLLDVQTLDWWPEACQRLGLASSMLVQPLRPGTPIGHTGATASRVGLPTGIPVAAGNLDHAMAAVGAGLDDDRDLCESTGTVIACLRFAERFQPRRGCCVGPAVGHGFFELTWDRCGGAILEDYRHRWAPELDFATLDREASAVPPGCDGLRALQSETAIRGDDYFSGRCATHGHGHAFRALIEGLTLRLLRAVARCAPDRPPRRLLAAGGGARSPFWLQLKADMLGLPVEAGAVPEPACRGAAMVAACAAGLFPDSAVAARSWSPQRRVYAPDAEAHARYRELGFQVDDVMHE